MKIILLRLLSVTFVLFGVNACVGPVGPAYGGGYGGGYDGGGYADEGYGPTTTYIVDNDIAYYDNYGHYSSYYRPGYVRYYGRYDRYGHRDPHGYYSRGGHDLRSHSSSGSRSVHHDDHRPNYPSRSSSGSSHQLYTHKSADSNRGAPQGQHTADWYKSRGMSTARLTPVNPGSSRSGSSSHSKKDDDDKKHHH